MTNPIIGVGGTKCWYNSNLDLHREDGPAVEFLNGAKKWYINGKLHREDGPARVRAKSKDWYINGERHRDDGPAIEYQSGKKRWWIKGNNITKEVNQWIIDNNFPEYEEWTDSIKVLFKLTFG